MSVLTEPRFLITLALVGAVTALVLTGHLAGETGLAALVGMLARLGADKATPPVQR